MRIYLKDDSRFQGLCFIGYAKLPKFKGSIVNLVAKQDSNKYTPSVPYSPMEIKMETKSFYIDKVANGCSPHAGYHDAIILSEVEDVKKYFGKIDKAI
jgi:hypothetical protein